jgi:hypothetical protein
LGWVVVAESVAEMGLAIVFNKFVLQLCSTSIMAIMLRLKNFAVSGFHDFKSRVLYLF